MSLRDGKSSISDKNKKDDKKIIDNAIWSMVSVIKFGVNPAIA